MPARGLLLPRPSESVPTFIVGRRLAEQPRHKLRGTGLKAMANGAERNQKRVNNLFNASKQAVKEIKNAPSTVTNMVVNGVKDKDKKH